MELGEGEPRSLSLDAVSAATRLLEKRKQMLEVQQVLDAQKGEYTRKEEQFQQREENLRKKDLELQEALVLFNKFLKENEAKRRRADRRANDEIRQKEQKEKEIGVRQERLAELKRKCALLKREVARNEKYQTFLRHVQTENMSEFPDIESILTRYFCLKDANGDLHVKQRAVTEQLETQRNELVQLSKDHHNQHLGLNNDIARLSKDLEEAQKRASALEEKVDAATMAELARILKNSQIIMAAENLFQRCKRSSSILNHVKSAEQVNEAGKPQQKEGPEADAGVADEAAAARRLQSLTEMRLEVVRAYLLDFASIAEQYC